MNELSKRLEALKKRTTALANDVDHRSNNKAKNDDDEKEKEEEVFMKEEMKSAENELRKSMKKMEVLRAKMHEIDRVDGHDGMRGRIKGERERFQGADFVRRRNSAIATATTQTERLYSPVKKKTATRDEGETKLEERRRSIDGSEMKRRGQRLGTPRLARGVVEASDDDDHPIEVSVKVKNGTRDPRRGRRRELDAALNRVEKIGVVEDVLLKSRTLDDFMFYSKEIQANKVRDEQIRNAVEVARSKIFLEVTNFLRTNNRLPEDADVISVAICEKFAELGVRNANLVKSAHDAREIIERLSAELNSFRDSCDTPTY
jgi:hypothetical protein